MKKYTYIGLIGTNKNGLEVGVLLQSNVSFEDLKSSDTVDAYDFLSQSLIDERGVYGLTDDTQAIVQRHYINLVERLLSLNNLQLTGESFKLRTPLDFGYSTDDYGLETDNNGCWNIQIKEIYQIKEE